MFVWVNSPTDVIEPEEVALPPDCAWTDTMCGAGGRLAHVQLASGYLRRIRGEWYGEVFIGIRGYGSWYRFTGPWQKVEEAALATRMMALAEGVA